MEALESILSELAAMPELERIPYLNKIRLALHELSPFKTEPVDCVLWVPCSEVAANDYNPNSVAPPEMKLLETSIMEDGYTQPIVAWRNEDHYEVVDGFHRNRVGKESISVKARIHGHLPIVPINAGRTDLGDRMASTIRHNRARGKHKITAMCDIVRSLVKRNWSDEKIAKELGMESDEVLRFRQIGGLAEVFGSGGFSKAWDPSIDESE
jgi:ParB-like chromosome segregation protein Spo0J